MKGLVSVIMGVHNEKPEYLRTAVDSICRQTYRVWEFIIIDDAASDACKALLAEYEAQNSKIHVFHNAENLGLTKSLNIGLAKAGGEYIARMDADDFSVPTRLEKQLRYLESNPDIDLCGTGVVSFGDRSIFLSSYTGMTNDEAQCCLFFSSALCHPSVMIRKTFLDDHNLTYDESVKKGQDYDMWERCSVCGKLAVMEEVLLFYRMHSGQITAVNKGDQDNSAIFVRKRRLARLGLVPDERELKCHRLLMEGKDAGITLGEIDAWIARIIEANRRVGLVNDNALCNDLAFRRVLFMFRNGHYLQLAGADGIKRLWRLLYERVAMRLKLNRESRKLKKLLRNELY